MEIENKEKLKYLNKLSNLILNRSDIEKFKELYNRFFKTYPPNNILQEYTKNIDEVCYYENDNYYYYEDEDENYF